MSDMYIYDDNNESSFENQYPKCEEQHLENSHGPNRKKPDNRMQRLAKRAGAIALSAVLFGGVAAGTFQSINRLTGYQSSGIQAGE